MIYAKTKQIMNTGIAKYSDIYEQQVEDTQILIKSDDSDGVNYQMCKKWNPNEEVTFKDIMDAKVDILGFEYMSAPFLRKSVDMYAKKYETDSPEMNLFIFKKDEKLGIAVYKQREFKEALTLQKQFERLGL